MAGLIWIPAYAGMRRAKHGGFDLDSRVRGNEAGEG
jgi:hypothetical protein